MSQIAPAIMYLVFAAANLLFCLMFQIEDASEMFQSSVQRLLDTPWQISPYKTIYNVKGGPEVYEWLTKTFLNQLYLEYPQPGDPQSYCTEGFKCMVDEGIAYNDNQCSGSLRKGVDNCPSYLGLGDCCEPCTGPNCEVFRPPTKTGDFAPENVSDLSKACADDMPSWLQELSQWNRMGSSIVAASVTPTDGPVTFCPERMSKVVSDIDTLTAEAGRTLMVAQHNRVLMARLTLKRVKIVPHESKSFSNAYGQQVNSDHTNAFAYSPSSENMDEFGADTKYRYQEGAGFRSNGGFVAYINFDKSKEQVLSEISKLKRNYWFDLNQGSFVVEMIMYNGNVNRFLSVTFVFEHDFSGLTEVIVIADQLDLSLHDPSKVATYIRVALYLIIVVLYVIFLKNEVDDMHADYESYFSSLMNFVQLTSLGLSAVCIVLYSQIVLSYNYINFDFPLSTDEGTQQKEMGALILLASRMGTFMVCISINIFLIFFRWITLMTTPFPASGVIFNTIGEMKYYLMAFFMMFAVMLLGFSFAGYYLFGTRISAYRTLAEATLSSVRMIQRDDNRATLGEGDSELGWIYFVVFHLFFIIVQQILVSVLIFGYDRERKRISEMVDADRYPLKKYWQSATRWVTHNTNWLFRWFVSLQQFFFDTPGGPAARPNWDTVARLRDRRETRPRIRKVDYGQLREGDNDDVKIAEDLTLRAVTPWYPNGMMHYYVDDVKTDGVAMEFKVTKNGFRLVAIQRHGVEDRKEFRSVASFEKYNKNPRELLEEAQRSRETSTVMLEFEGGVKAVSKECALLMFFISVFITFAIFVSRVQDSFSLTVLHRRALITPHWYEHNPTRIVSLDTMDSINALEQWVQNTILDKEYECVTKINNPQECAVSQLTRENRQDWRMWKRPEPEMPQAADGLSLGFIPNTVPGRSVEITQTVRMEEYNIGVMPNNHVRLTLQVACYTNNTNDRWSQGYPILLDPVLLSWNCARSPCMGTMIENGEGCLNAQGESRQLRSSTGSWSKLDYTFTEAGTYNEMGGFAIGLGNTRAEGSQVLEILKQDRLFRSDSISFVFEFVTYNANYDMFTYTTVEFSQKGTGKFEHDVRTSVFPLTIFSAGPAEGTIQTVNTILFVLYVLTAVLFMAYFLWDLVIQYFITVNLSRKWYMTLPDFLQEDGWNVVDAVSVLLNVLVLEAISAYWLVGGRVEISREGVRSWTMDYGFEDTANLNTVDQFAEFAEVARIYQYFTEVAAMNGLFLLIRLVKFFGGLSPLRLVMTAMGKAINEILVMLLIFIVMLLSFMLMFFMRWGVQHERFGTPLGSFTNLFLFLAGRFNTEDISANSPMFFIVFLGFEVVFLLLLNMFLAAIVYQWKDTRRDAQEVTLWGTLQKLREPFSWSMLSFEKGKEQEQPRLKLDADYWVKLSVLQHIAHLDESGQIKISKEGFRHGPAEGDAPRDGEGADSEAESDKGGEEGGFNFDLPEDRTKFLKVFKKAHMEIASQMCRSGEVPRGDEEGREEEKDPSEFEEDLQINFEDEFSQVEMIGIIEEPQTKERASEIEARMNEKLAESEHPAEEIWLDALVTVLEEAGALERLQRFFRPLPMIKPTKAQEILNFKQKKAKMECRLNMFLRWLQEEARIKHYQYLKRMAQDKEKNLKQQSLVLTDYLETLDQQITSLEKDIKMLERRNAHMRSHVSPLL